MNTGDWIYWLGWMLVLGINVAMIYLSWWGLFGDKPRGRRRCPRCWHDLSHTPGLTCGECGHVARSERHLGRCRRRWVAAVLGIVVCVAVAAFVSDRIERQGLTGLLPTKVLVVCLPVMGDSNSSLCKELTDRARRSGLSDREWAMLMRRCATGDWWARPASDAWGQKYGRYVTLRRWMVEQDPNLDWEPGVAATLLALPLQIDLTTRESWPEGSSVHVRLHAREWWPEHWDMRVTVAPLGDPAAATTMVRRRRTRRDCWFALPPLDSSAEELPLDVTVERRRRDADADETWETVHRESMLLATRGGGAIEDLMAPVGGLEIDEALRQTFYRGVVKWSDGGPSPVRVYFFPQSTYLDTFNEVAIGARVQILFDGELARQLDLWWLAGSEAERGGWEASRERIDLLENAEAESGRWQMRVTGDPSLALRAGEADFYWDGEFIVPLGVNERPGVAGRPTWERVDDEQRDSGES